MTNTQVVTKIQESLKLAAQDAVDKGETTWSTKRHNGTVAIVLSGAIAQGWKPTPAEVFEVIQTSYNHSAWRQKFEKEGLFKAGSKSGDRDISAFLNGLKAEGIGE